MTIIKHPLAESRDPRTKPDTQGIARLRTLYAMFAGLPASKINLNQFYGDSTVPSELAHTCGTVACVGGWAAVYPEFVAQGLRAGRKGTIYLAGHSRKELDGQFAVLARFFGMSMEDATSVFGFMTHGRYCDPSTSITERFRSLSHKRVGLMRIRNYLYAKGAITAERYQELKKFEEQF